MIERLKEKWIEAAINYGQAIKDKDSSLINKNYDLIDKVYKELISFGEEGRRAIIQLMEHQNPYVKLSSATKALNFAEERAKKVLLQLKSMGGPLGFDAGMVLKEWKRENLRE